MPTVVQKSFAGGIMGPMMHGRSDDAKYMTGLKECKNFICLPQGALQNRAGFKYVATTKYHDRASRLVPFTFSVNQTMILEFGDKYVRFYTEGKPLINDDGTPYEIESQFSHTDLFELNFVQSADVLTVVHQKYPPVELKRYSARDWRFEKINFLSTLPAPANCVASKYTTADNESNSDKYVFKYCVTALNADRTIQSERSNISSVRANIYNTGTTIRISWNAVEGAAFYRVYRAEGGVYCYIGETGDIELIDDNIAPDKDYTPPRIDDIFNVSRGIKSVEVVNGGTGYKFSEHGVAAPADMSRATFVYTNSVPKWYDRDFSSLCTLKGWKSQSWTGAAVWTSTRSFSYTEEIARSKIGIVDAKGLGKGATFEPIFSRSIRVESERSPYDEHVDVTYYDVELVGVKITNTGYGYEKPELWVYAGAAVGLAAIVYRYVYVLESKNIGATVTITDPDGSGAEVVPYVSNGVITGFRIDCQGSGYTDPKVVINPNGYGSGASATASSGDASDYPAAVTYFEQRRVFAATPTRPQGIWMTKTGTEANFTYCIPTRDDDRISFKIASRERHKVMHLVPLNRLLVLTESGEWAVASINSDAITPASIALKSQSFIGSDYVRPQIVNNNILYCAARGGHVREMGYSYNAGGYTTGDVSIRCAHLFDGYRLTDSAFSKAPHPIAWFVSSSGSLLGLTYIPDQQIAAWHEHTTLGRFESVASVAEGDEDAVYVVTLRMVNGKFTRFIERMQSRSFQDDKDAFFVDCGGTYAGDETRRVTGINWLEGETVSILADGSELPQQTVKDGAIDLPVAAHTVHVGLPIDAKFTTLPVTITDKSGQGGEDKLKNINSVFMRVYRSSGIFVGPEDGELVEYRQRTTETPGDPPAPVTGGIEIDLHPDWNDSGCVTVSQKSPMPLTVLSITSDIELGG